MALLCAVKELGVKRIITSRLEHHAVGHTAENICAEFDVELQYVRHCGKGNIDLENLEELLTDSKKTLVSLMHANNEIATLIPLKEVAQMCRKHRAFFHSDTVQTMGHYAFDLKELDIDFLTCAAHKFHGPKGIGFLYSNLKTQMIPMIHGGSQERGYRGGTENIYGIVGLSAAMDLAYSDLTEHQHHVQGLKDYMIDELKKYFSDVYFHGETAKEKSLYTVLNVCFPATDKASMLLFTLDLKGVAASGGSACSSGATKGSHVLDGIQADMNRPNVRFSFSRYTTKEEIDYAIGEIVNVFEKKIV
jgi:cysteine desulfurase